MSELRQHPWYTEDILYGIAEKLLAKVPDGGKITFCEQNPFTWFMGHNQMAIRVVIAQFAKFKRIDFIKDREGRRIEFYKNADKSARINESQTEDFSFGGPYIVPPGMLEYIIEKGKFRVNTIGTSYFLPDDHSTDVNEFGEMNSLKAFCALFLGKQIQIPDGLNNTIEIREFTVNETLVSIQNNLETILAIGAVELKFHRSNIIIDCSQYNNPIIANNPTEITMEPAFNFKFFEENNDKFTANFGKFCSFLIRACPALNNLHITFWNLSLYQFTDNLYTIIMAMEAGIKSIGIAMNICKFQSNCVSISLTMFMIIFQLETMICSNLALHSLLKAFLTMLTNTLLAQWNLLMFVAGPINCCSKLFRE